MSVNDNVRQESYIAIQDEKQCTACRACVVACSYHHSACFSTIHSSIIIDRNFETGKIQIDIDESCDKCLPLELPFCLMFCPRDVLALVYKK